MTNTHINVGGHKITTNKVGEVKNLTSEESSITINQLKYCVVNGLCCLTLWGVTSTTYGSTKTVSTKIPTPKNGIVMGGLLYDEASGTSSAKVYADFWVYNNNGIGTLQTLFLGSMSRPCYGSITYPVADDWVES